MTAPLPTDVKKFIVTHVACGRSPTEIAKKVAAEYGIEVSPQLVMRYDPRTISGKHLNAGLRELFYAARKAFLEGVHNLDLAHRESKLARLEDLYEEAAEKGLIKERIAIIAESRKQMQDLLGYDDDEPYGPAHED